MSLDQKIEQMTNENIPVNVFPSPNSYTLGNTASPAEVMSKYASSGDMGGAMQFAFQNKEDVLGNMSFGQKMGYAMQARRLLKEEGELGDQARAAWTQFRSQKGFSLIELLVVISIVGILIGTLLPAMAGARDAAEMVKCASNQSQIGKATHMFGVDNDDYMPLRGGESLTPSAGYYSSAPGVNPFVFNGILVGQDYLNELGLYDDTATFYTPEGTLGMGNNSTRTGSYLWFSQSQRLSDVEGKALLTENNQFYNLQPARINDHNFKINILRYDASVFSVKDKDYEVSCNNADAIAIRDDVNAIVAGQ